MLLLKTISVKNAFPKTPAIAEALNFVAKFSYFYAVFPTGIKVQNIFRPITYLSPIETPANRNPVR